MVKQEGWAVQQGEAFVTVATCWLSSR